MYTTAIYSASIATATATDLTAIPDQVLYIQNNHFIPQSDMRLLFAAAYGATIKRAYLTSPFFRNVTPSHIRPITVGATPGTNPNVACWLQNPLWVRGMEELQVYSYQDSGGAERNNCVIALGDGITPIPQGPVFTLRGVSTTAAVALTWTQVAITWDQTLPAGRYAVVLSEHFSATAHAHRLTFDNQWMRPGGLSNVSAGQRSIYPFDQYQLGTMGVCTPTSMPRVEVFCTTTDAAHEVYIDVVRIPGS